LLVLALAMTLCACNGSSLPDDYVFQNLSVSPSKPAQGERVTLHASIWDPNGYTDEAPSYQFEASAGELIARPGKSNEVRGASVATHNCDVVWVAPTKPGVYTLTASYAGVSKTISVRVYSKPGSVEKVGPAAP
jgi:hypothetical protein